MFKPQAPDGFECPYEHSCPYLDHLSTQWVFDEYHRADQREDELSAIIEDQDKVIERLEKENKRLEDELAQMRARFNAAHRRQFKSRKSAGTRELRGDSPSGKEKAPPKKRGAPVGHPGWFRPKPDHIDATIQVPAPERCPHCQSSRLRGLEETEEHLQEDIVLTPRVVVSRYIHEQAQCLGCGQVVTGVGQGEMPNAHIGPVAKSLSVYLRHAMGLSYRKNQRLFEELFGLKFVPASAVGFDRKAATKGQALYDDLRDKIQACQAVHADETSWRQDGENGYVWYAGNRDLAYFHIDKSRSGQVAASVLGEHFAGTLIADAYAAYNATHPRDRQSCLVHVARRAKEIGQEIPPPGKKGHDSHAAAFCRKIRKLFAIACRIAHRIETRQWKATRPRRIQRRLEAVLDRLCARPLRHERSETLRKRLQGKERQWLFTFLRHDGVPATNNHAEQSLRPIVILRKTSFGTRSEKGSWVHSVLPSLALTAKRQGKDQRRFFEILLTSETADAQAALYKNPP